MREIKFRCWDGKKMEVVNSLIRPFNENTMYVGEYDGSGYPKYDGYPILQYTGLHDKNGKEIYEGDVIEAFNGFYGKIIFENGKFTYDISGEVPNMFNVEVIGNIYENPELLEGSIDG